jgi:hypothetical protein
VQGSLHHAFGAEFFLRRLGSLGAGRVSPRLVREYLNNFRREIVGVAFGSIAGAAFGNYLEDPADLGRHNRNARCMGLDHDIWQSFGFRRQQQDVHCVVPGVDVDMAEKMHMIRDSQDFDALRHSVA